MSHRASRVPAVLAAALAAGCASKVPAENPPPDVVYAVRFLPGPNWVTGKPAHEQPGIQDHIVNMNKLEADGRMRFGGPFLDGTGGLCAITADSLEQAKSVAAADPGVTSGLLVPEVHPWVLVMPPKPRRD